MNPEKITRIREVLSKKRVLIVEDHANARSLYREGLEQSGFLVDEAGSLTAALVRVEERTYHVAVVDIMLGGPDDRTNRDGIDVLNAIKSLRNEGASVRLKRLIGTRLIALTGQEEPELAADIISKHGANEYIDKLKYRRTLVEEIVRRVTAQATECKLGLYGPYESAIEFLAGPTGAAVWTDKCLSILKVGYGTLQHLLTQLCDHIAPIVGQSGQQSGDLIDIDANVIRGNLWSKALAMPVTFIVCRENAINTVTKSRADDWDEDKLISSLHEEGLVGRIYEIEKVTRAAFVRELNI